MAKIKFGMMMTDARGKLGGQVFSKNRSGAYIRTKVTPVNPQTASQSRVRSMLALLSSNWNTLTAENRNSWNSAVEAWQTTDIFGDIKKPSGKNLFVKLNINLTNSQQSPVLVAPEKIALPTLSHASASFTVATDTLVVGNLPQSAIGNYVIEATPPLNAGVSFAKNRFRQIGAFPLASGMQIDVTSAYVAKFGALVGGENVQFRVKFIGENGQASPAIILKMATI